jgi:hypothetical protein
MPLELKDNYVPEGHDVFSYGYPLTEVILENNYSTKVNLISMIFKGYIHAHWEDNSTGGFDNVYALSFPAIPGLSGSPLLVSGIEGKLYAAGIIYQNHRSLGKKLIEEDSIEENGQKVISRVFMGYEIGISSDHFPFLKIKKLIDEVSSNLAQKKAK